MRRFHFSSCCWPLLFLLLAPGVASAQTQRELEVRQIEAESALISGEIWAISKPGFTEPARALRITDYAGLARIEAGTSLAGQPTMRWLRNPIGDPNPDGTAVVEISSQNLGGFEVGRVQVFNSAVASEVATLTSSGLTARGISLVHQLAPASLSIQAQNAGNSVTILGPASTLGYSLELPTANAAGFLSNNGSGVTSWSAGNFVTLDTTQTITGAKTFTTNNVKLNVIALQLADAGGTVYHSLLNEGVNFSALLNSSGQVAQRWDSALGQILLGVSAAPMDIIGTGSMMFAEKTSGNWTNFARASGGSNHTNTWPNANAAGVLSNDGSGGLSWSTASGACGAAGLVQYSGGSGVFDCEAALSYDEGTNTLTAGVFSGELRHTAASILDPEANTVISLTYQDVGGAFDRGLITVTNDTASNQTTISDVSVATFNVSVTEIDLSDSGGRIEFNEPGAGFDIITMAAPASFSTYNLTLPNAAPANGTQTCGGGTHVSVLVLQNGWVMQVGCS